MVGLPAEKLDDGFVLFVRQSQNPVYFPLHEQNDSCVCIPGGKVCDTAYMPAKSKRGKSPMSQAHKDALAIGREEGRAVRRYLEALEAHKPKRGRKRSPESIQKRLTAIEEKLPEADPLSRLQLVQARMDLERQLGAADPSVNLSEREDEFV